jgi:broad specificity phosphatase PhoE
MHTIHQNGKAVRANSVVSILKMLKALAFQGNLRAVEILLKRADARAAAIAKRGGKDPTAESADLLVEALRQTFLGKWDGEEDE